VPRRVFPVARRAGRVEAAAVQSLKVTGHLAAAMRLNGFPRCTVVVVCSLKDVGIDMASEFTSGCCAKCGADLMRPTRSLRITNETVALTCRACFQRAEGDAARMKDA
jgi:hypothetical protein